MCLTERFETKLSLFHGAVIALSVMLSLFAWKYYKTQIEARTQQRFDVAADNTAKLIVDRLTKYEDALWSGVAAISSHSGDMNHAEWTTFAQTLELETKYPGTNGIGVIDFLRPDQVPAYLSRQRMTRPDFAIKPAHEFNFLMPITSIIPVDANLQAVGLDVAFETNRRSAAFAARDTGKAAITGPIELVQDANSTAGFLFYAPFYDTRTPNTKEARQAEFRGAVYAPIIVAKLMDGLMPKNFRQVSFDLRDGDATIYSEFTPDNEVLDPDPMHSTELPISVYGRTWTLDIHSDLTFRAANTYTQPNWILAGGFFVEALIVTIIILLTRSNQNAARYADKVTKELRKKSDEILAANTTLHRKNKELEQFSYVASHDLKTPIRGIGGLVEMIEEDLEPYFKTETANQDVQRNLRLIQERVLRMTHLTEGLLAMSTVAPMVSATQNMALDRMVASLISDFDLTKDQITLHADIKAARVDTLNLRRVFENLTSNAIKYHTGDGALKIEINVETQGNFCMIRFDDNGPGIDPAYRKKVFELFETLGVDLGQNATGIGLAIVKKAVEQHGGTITVGQSAMGGASFTFQWPHAATPPATVEISNAA